LVNPVWPAAFSVSTLYSSMQFQWLSSSGWVTSGYILQPASQVFAWSNLWLIQVLSLPNLFLALGFLHKRGIPAQVAEYCLYWASHFPPTRWRWHRAEMAHWAPGKKEQLLAVLACFILHMTVGAPMDINPAWVTSSFHTNCYTC
jgi:hypothetical protein